MNLEERFYTSTEVAEILGVSLRSVYRYLEEGKLDAEVKTATGRHRFTKENILNFLYPGKAELAPRMAKAEPSTSSKSTSDVQTSIIESKVKVRPSEEPVDWLAKFREAADKFKTETEKPAVIHEEPAVVSSLSFEPQVPREKQEEASGSKLFYYRSSLAGLKREMPLLVLAQILCSASSSSP